MPNIDLKTGTNVIVGRPRKALPSRQVKRISALLASIGEIREAHLPEILAVGEAAGAQTVLFVVVEPTAAAVAVRERIEAGLERALKGRLALWVVPIGHELIDTVREAHCVVGWRD